MRTFRLRKPKGYNDKIPRKEMLTRLQKQGYRLVHLEGKTSKELRGMVNRLPSGMGRGLEPMRPLREQRRRIY